MQHNYVSYSCVSYKKDTVRSRFLIKVYSYMVLSEECRCDLSCNCPKTMVPTWGALFIHPSQVLPKGSQVSTRRGGFTRCVTYINNHQKLLQNGILVQKLYNSTTKNPKRTWHNGTAPFIPKIRSNLSKNILFERSP